MQDETLIRRALLTIKELRNELEAARSRGTEPIAISAMACHFPGGVSNPDEYWDLVASGRDAISRVPANRWSAEAYLDTDPDAPGKTYVAYGGFLADDLYRFDPAFFSISDAETREMDPQHRLLLTTSWEALESAALPSDRLPGHRIGVYVGATASEYATLPRNTDIGPYAATGSVMSVAVGRISHTLGLSGPALAVDTACSSSLVAVHLAVGALRSAQIDAALVGGVNALLSPAPFVMLSKMHALSPDGRCKVFDEAADGYVRSEGCGMVVLRRLSDAQADGSPILAVIRGTAINHDGHSSGVTVPNGAAQRRLISEALESAQLEPEQVDYLEAHGTGTPLGDPIEVRAALESYASERRKAPLLVGSAKSVVGHLEAAAGVAGLIKAVLSLRHAQVPPNVHLTKLNSRITADVSSVRFPTVLEPWPDTAVRAAGISSFGFNGTNAHIIITQADENDDAAADEPGHRTAYPLVMSARADEPLAESMRRLLLYVEAQPETSLASLCRTMCEGRVQHRVRRGFCVKSIDDAVRQLTDAIDRGRSSRGAGGNIAMVFGGHLEAPSAILDELATESVFVDTWNQVAQWLDAHQQAGVDGSCDELLTRAAQDFAAQLGVARLWTSWGIRPAAVLAEGDGDIPAAVVAGLLTEDEALAILAQRHGQGPVVDVELRPAQVRFICADGRAQTGADSWNQPCPPLDVAAQMTALLGRGYRAVVYVSGRELGGAGTDTVVVASASGAEGAWELLSSGVSRLAQEGWDMDWQRFFQTVPARMLNLPTYPFQYRLFLEDPVAVADGQTQETVPGSLVASPLPTRQVEARINTWLLPEIADTGGLFHIGYYTRMVEHALRELGMVGDMIVEDFTFVKALHISGTDDRLVQMVMGSPDDQGKQPFEFHSREANGDVWELHARGTVHARHVPMRPKVTSEGRQEVMDQCPQTLEGSDFYRDYAARGFEVGASVRLVKEVRIGARQALARIRTRASEGAAAAHLSPGFFDACAQLAMIAGRDQLADDDLYITVDIAHFEVPDRRWGEEVWCHLWAVDDQEAGSISVDFDVYDGSGNYMTRCQGMRLRVIPKELTGEVAGVPGDDGTVVDARAGGLSSEADEELESRIRGHLVAVVQDILGNGDGDVPLDVSLAELGLESLAALELRRSVKNEFGVQLSLELLIQGPSIESLGASILRIINGADDSGSRDEADEQVSWHSGEYSTQPGDWLAHERLTAAPRARLFCIPYGIKGASLYASWKSLLPDDIDVCPVQFPGKEGRINERPISEMDEAVGALEQVLAGYMDRPFAIYGHSVGALVAFRLAHRLAERSDGLLRHLFVGAFSSPSIGSNPVYDRVVESFQEFGFDTLPEVEELIQMPKDRSQEYEDYISESFGIEVNDEMRDALKPVGYSDFRLVHTYQFDPDEERLTIPIAGYHGRRDTFVVEEEMRAWEGLTSGSFALRVFEGDHFFLHHDQSEQELLDDLRDRLYSVS